MLDCHLNTATYLHSYNFQLALSHSLYGWYPLCIYQSLHYFWLQVDSHSVNFHSPHYDSMFHTPQYVGFGWLLAEVTGITQLNLQPASTDIFQMTSNQSLLVCVPQSKCAPIQVCPSPSVPQSKCAPIQDLDWGTFGLGYTWIGSHSDCVTLGLGHTWIGAHSDWGTLGLEHTWIGAHLDWGTLGLGHTRIGAHLDWVTLGLGHTWIGAPLDWVTFGLGHTWIVSHLDCVTLGLGHTWIGAHLDWGTLGLGHTWIGARIQVDFGLMSFEKCLYSQVEG